MSISLLPARLYAQNNYPLYIQQVDKDSSLPAKAFGLQTVFNRKEDAIDYIYKIPALMALKGYPAASVDTVYVDSSAAHISLFAGKQYKWIRINTDSIDKRVLDATGWNSNLYQDKLLNFSELQNQQARIIAYYERTGYPFASVKLDNVVFNEDSISGVLRVRRGLLYHIDSIHVFGKVKIRNSFFQHYLGIFPGSPYNQDKLNDISKRLLELPYLQEEGRSNLSMLGTGATLNLYLQPKRSSQVNVLIGLLPANDQTGQVQLTGDVNLNLKNALGAGETILLSWQQLQLKSPRLNIGYQHPYIFNSAFGIDFSFDLLKKDSSYLQLNSQFGIQYILSANKSGRLFIQDQRSFLLPGGFDTNQIRITKRLPDYIDVNAVSIGVDYQYYNTNYRYNPRKGNELSFLTSVGLKTITKNNDILNLKDTAHPTFQFKSLYDSIKPSAYQFRVKLSAAHYFPSGKRSVLKTAVNAAIFQSQHTFRNELFQIGGYRLLRGFDEESIYASQYAVFTAEYRYLVGLNSFLFVFSDLGWAKATYENNNYKNTFIGTGLGLSFETKVGLLNVSLAIGKRDDVKFDIRQASKIHFGYVNYF